MMSRLLRRIITVLHATTLLNYRILKNATVLLQGICIMCLRWMGMLKFGPFDFSRELQLSNATLSKANSSFKSCDFGRQTEKHYWHSWVCGHAPKLSSNQLPTHQCKHHPTNNLSRHTLLSNLQSTTATRVPSYNHTEYAHIYPAQFWQENYNRDIILIYVWSSCCKQWNQDYNK